jgi:hypothetical protein
MLVAEVARLRGLPESVRILANSATEMLHSVAGCSAATGPRWDKSTECKKLALYDFPFIAKVSQPQTQAIRKNIPADDFQQGYAETRPRHDQGSRQAKTRLHIESKEGNDGVASCLRALRRCTRRQQ